MIHANLPAVYPACSPAFVKTLVADHFPYRSLYPQSAQTAGYSKNRHCLGPALRPGGGGTGICQRAGDTPRGWLFKIAPGTPVTAR